MKENVCVDCKHYESCKKPERYMKCMGYEEKERQQAAGENAAETSADAQGADQAEGTEAAETSAASGN